MNISEIENWWDHRVVSGAPRSVRLACSRWSQASLRSSGRDWRPRGHGHELGHRHERPRGRGPRARAPARAPTWARPAKPLVQDVLSVRFADGAGRPQLEALDL